MDDLTNEINKKMEGSAHFALMTVLLLLDYKQSVRVRMALLRVAGV